MKALKCAIAIVAASLLVDGWMLKKYLGYADLPAFTIHIQTPHPPLDYLLIETKCDGANYCFQNITEYGTEANGNIVLIYSVSQITGEVK